MLYKTVKHNNAMLEGISKQPSKKKVMSKEAKL